MSTGVKLCKCCFGIFNFKNHYARCAACRGICEKGNPCEVWKDLDIEQKIGLSKMMQ